MATKWLEYVASGSNANVWFADGLAAQTFTTAGAFSVTSVKFYDVSINGNVRAYIYAVDGNGKPTGSPLCSSAITAISGNGWKELAFTSNPTLMPYTQYAIVLHNQTASNGGLKEDSTGSYTGGQQFYSQDSNLANLTLRTLGGVYTDLAFELWGVVAPLDADFTVPSVKAALNSEVVFTSTSVGGYLPYSFLWDFGDGETSTQEQPTHIYTTPGFYTVSLTVTDDVDTSNVETKTSYMWIQANEIFVELADEEDKTPVSVDSWVDVDVSAIVNANATGVLVHIINLSASEQTYGLRRNGYTANITGKVAAGSQTWAIIGIDGSLRLEAYISSTNVKVYIYGYSMFGVSFISPVEKTHTGGWNDINCSSNVSALATGLLFIVKNTSLDTIHAYGLRPHGGSDSFTQGSPGYINLAPGQMHFVTVGCDTGQICEFQSTETSEVDLYLIGYIFDSTTFLPAAYNASLDLFGLYTDVDASGINHYSGWVLVQVNCADKAGRYAAMRYPGNAVDDYKAIQYGAWKWQKVNASHIFEGKIQDSNVRFFIPAYAQESVYNLVSINGFVRIGTTPIPDADVLCYNLSRRTFVGHTQTDGDGQYTFTDAGYEFEDFLVACHCLDGQLRRYGQCKQIKLLELA